MGNAKVQPKNALLLPYQKRWVEDSSRLKLAVKSRQIGWTWATAYGLIRRKSLKTAALDAWISSRDEIQARLFLEDCKSFAGVLDAGAQDFGERVIDGKGSSAYVLQMGNGLRINSMSSNPDAQAGKRGDRVLDEFALHPDPRKLYAIAYPGITWGGSFEVFSTPRGSDSFFQKLIDEIRGGNPKKFSFHQITLEDALNQGFLAKLQKKLPEGDERQAMDEAAYFDYIKAGCADEETFAQEYMCVPSNDATAFITYEMLDGNRVPGRVETERGTVDGRPSEIVRWTNVAPGVDVAEAPLYLGVDYARHQDLTVMWLAAEIAGILVAVELLTMKNVPFKRQRAALDGYME
ncbi:MAG: terminase family protein, partial [bacterium]|nr:terminase family protein [bacterium]